MCILSPFPRKWERLKIFNPTDGATEKIKERNLLYKQNIFIHKVLFVSRAISFKSHHFKLGMTISL